MWCVADRHGNRVSTCSSSRSSWSSESDDGEHNVWNPVLGLCCHNQVGPLVEDILTQEEGPQQVATLQEASEYVDHDILTSRFHVTHYAGCAILFNKDTFYPNVDVKSMTQDETCLIKLWKENREGSYKVFFHVPYFVDQQ